MTLGRCPLSIFCSRGTPPREPLIAAACRNSEEIKGPTFEEMKGSNSEEVRPHPPQPLNPP